MCEKQKDLYITYLHNRKERGYMFNIKEKGLDKILSSKFIGALGLRVIVSAL